MTKQQISEIVEASETLVKNTASLLDKLSDLKDESGASYSVSEIVSSTQSSPSDWLAKVSTIDGITKKFDKSSHHLMVPQAALVNLANCFQTANTKITDLHTNLFITLENSGGLKKFDYQSFHALAKNGQNHNFHSFFKKADDSIEALLEAFFRVLVILRPTKATYSFQAATNALSEMIGKTHSEYETFRNKKSELDIALADASETNKLLGEMAEEVKRLKRECASDKKSITEYLADATEKSVAINKVHSDATELESTIREYEEKFQSFDRQLEDREKAFVNGIEALNRLVRRLNNQKTIVEDLVKQSEDMLKGATVAGLAGRFEQIRSDLTNELDSARRTFYWGIVFLFASAIPLITFIFLPVLAPLLEASLPGFTDATKTYTASSSVTGWQYLGQVLARFIILLPAAWFVSFAAIRHSSLFRLREHYAYKYSMAVSVEGFKKQAKGYEDEIAALVLEQLAFNPADKLVPSKEVKEANVPKPMMDLFIKKLQSRIDKVGSGDK